MLFLNFLKSNDQFSPNFHLFIHLSKFLLYTTRISYHSFTPKITEKKKKNVKLSDILRGMQIETGTDIDPSLSLHNDVTIGSVYKNTKNRIYMRRVRRILSSY